jgi:hypothetical protein
MRNVSARLFVVVFLLAAAGPVTVTFTASALPENIPDFSQDASRPGIQSVQSGSWSNPTTWGGNVPTANHVARIVQGHTVTIDDTSASAYTIAVDGKLAFAPSVNTRLKVTNLEVMAGAMGMGTRGVLEVGTAAVPIAADVTAEIVIADSPLGGGVPDPDQFGTGINVFGKVSMHGSVKTPTFLRLATEPRAGDMALTLSAPVSGWRRRPARPADTRHIKKAKSPEAAGSTPSTSGKNGSCRRFPPMAEPSRSTARCSTPTSALAI